MTDADLELFTAEMPDLMATIARDVDFRWVHEGILITDIIQHRETLKVILKSLCDDMFDEIVTVTAPSRPPEQTRLCLPKKVSCKVPVLLQLRKHVANQSEWANLSCRLSQELRFAGSELRSENMDMLQAKTLALTQEQHGVHTAAPKHLNADRPLDIQHLANISVHIKMLEILQWSIEMLPVLPLELLAGQFLKPDKEVRGKTKSTLTEPKHPWLVDKSATEEGDVRVLYHLVVSCSPFSMQRALEKAREMLCDLIVSRGQFSTQEEIEQGSIRCKEAFDAAHVAGEGSEVEYTKSVRDIGLHHSSVTTAIRKSTVMQHREAEERRREKAREKPRQEWVKANHNKENVRNKNGHGHLGRET
jgi:hypothetical protein